MRLFYKKSWSVGWNEHWHFAVIYIEKYHIIVPIIEYFLYCCILPLKYIPLPSFNCILKPLHPLRKRANRLYIDIVRNDGKLTYIETLLYIIFLADFIRFIIRTIRTLNVHLLRMQVFYKTFGGVFKEHSQWIVDSINSKYYNIIEIPVSIDIAKEMFPDKYESYIKNKKEDKNITESFLNIKDNKKREMYYKYIEQYMSNWGIRYRILMNGMDKQYIIDRIEFNIKLDKDINEIMNKKVDSISISNIADHINNFKLNSNVKISNIINLYKN